MFTFFKRLLDRVPRRLAGLYPECLFSVVVTETEIVNHRPNGEMERVAFAELIAVSSRRMILGRWEPTSGGSWSAIVRRAAASFLAAPPASKMPSRRFRGFPALTTGNSSKP